MQHRRGATGGTWHEQRLGAIEMCELCLQLIAPAIFLLAGLAQLILGYVMGDREPLFLRIFLFVIMISAATVEVINIWNNYKTEEMKDQRIASLERDLQGLTQYSAVAELNLFGAPDIVIFGSRMRTEISEALDGAYIEIIDGQNRKYEPRCDDKGVEQFTNVTKNYPDFPFSHVALAICLKDAGKPQWREHAHRATEILEYTTQIAGHHVHHDEAQRILELLLKQ